MASTAEWTATAVVFDLKDMSCFEVQMRDLSDTGCWIVSDKVSGLSNEVGIRLDGVDDLVHATVVAQGQNEAQIHFRQAQTKPAERRREARQPVYITAIVCGITNPVSEKCLIVDASKSGCRLESSRLDRLPDDVEVAIPKMDMPVAGKIVWRKDNQAGVSLNWPVDIDTTSTLDDLIGKYLDTQKKPEKQKRKTKLTAYGR